MSEVSAAASESTKIPKLQQELQEFDENFEVIGLINFNWGHSVNKALPISDKRTRARCFPQSKNIIIKKKYVLRYLAGQERVCRVSGMAQRILNLRSKDQDMHRVPKVALQPWPTLAGTEALIGYMTRYEVGKTYFRADQFCRWESGPRQTRSQEEAPKETIELTRGNPEQQVVPVLACEVQVYCLP